MHQVEIRGKDIWVDDVWTYILCENSDANDPFPAWTVINLKGQEVFSHDYRHEIVEIIARDEIDYYKWERDLRFKFTNLSKIHTVKHLRVASAEDPERHYLLKLAATLGVVISWPEDRNEDGMYPYFNLAEAVNLYDKYYNHIHIYE